MEEEPCVLTNENSGAVIAEVNQNPNIPTYKNNMGKNEVGNTVKKRRRKRTNE